METRVKRCDALARDRAWRLKWGSSDFINRAFASSIYLNLTCASFIFYHLCETMYLQFTYAVCIDSRIVAKRVAPLFPRVFPVLHMSTLEGRHFGSEIRSDL